MIFYVLAPLILVPLVYKLNVLAFLVSAVLIGVHVTCNIWLIDKFNFDILRHQADYFEKLYFKPWARVAPYVIGLIFGWIYFKLNGRQFKLKQTTVSPTSALCAAASHPHSSSPTKTFLQRPYPTSATSLQEVNPPSPRWSCTCPASTASGSLT